MQGNQVSERRLSVRRGSEGPRHDPYSFEEWSVHQTINGVEKSITLHMGLAVWLKVEHLVVDPEFEGLPPEEKKLMRPYWSEKLRADYYGSAIYDTFECGLNRGNWIPPDEEEAKRRGVPLGEKRAEFDFFQLTGVHPEDFEKLYSRIQWFCRKCGTRPFKPFSAGGYPGETLYVCSRCEDVFAADFNPRAVE